MHPELFPTRSRLDRFPLWRLLRDRHRRRALWDVATADCFTCVALFTDDRFDAERRATTLVVPPGDLAARAGVIDGMRDVVGDLGEALLFAGLDGWGDRVESPIVEDQRVES
jgi:hypothetical protein